MTTATANTVRGWERINKDDVALLIVDHQVGLFQLVRDYTPGEFRANIIAHAALGKVFGLPAVITTSTETGPNGPTPPEIVAIHPDAPLIKRTGEVNAWDSKEFREAVKATGKKQLIVAGITTDVCVAFLSLSLRDAGYEVFVNHDASGSFSQLTSDQAYHRMRAAGVHILGGWAIVADLMRDWRHTPGAPELVPYFDKHLASFSYLNHAHSAAIEEGVPL